MLQPLTDDMKMLEISGITYLFEGKNHRVWWTLSMVVQKI